MIAALLNPALPLALWFSLHAFFPLIHDWAGVPRPAFLVTAYLAVCLAYARWRDRAAIPRPAVEDILFGLFVLVAALSGLFATALGFEAVLRVLVAPMLVPWVGARLLSSAETETFLSYLLLFGVVLLLVTLGATLNADASLERVYLLPEWVLSGLVGLPLSALTAISAALLLRAGAQRDRPAVAAAYWALMGLSAATVVYLGTRSATVGVLAVVVLLAALSRWTTLRYRVALIGFMVTIVLATLAVVPESRSGHFAELLSFGDSYHRARLAEAARDCNIKQDSIAIRVFMFKEAWQQFLASPLTGVGAGRYGFESCLFRYQTEFASPHSSLVHVMAELGLAGLVPGIALAALLMRRLWCAARGELSTRAWILLAVWSVALARDQFLGSYYALPDIYIISALIVSTVALPQRRSA